MRIALLSYRSKAHCGGQGVYVRYLSQGLVELGHQVEVFSGQPYPEDLDPRVRLTEVPSLDLYRDDDPFRTPHPREIRDRIDLLELATIAQGRRSVTARDVLDYLLVDPEAPSTRCSANTPALSASTPVN